MRPAPVRIAAVAALVVAASLAVEGRLRAQEEPAAPPRAAGAEPGDDAAVLRARGASAWRNYVWSLDRTRLAASLDELERARSLSGGRADFTQLYLIAFGHLVLGHEEAGRAAAREVREARADFAATLFLDAFEAILAGENEEGVQHLDALVNTLETSPPGTPLDAELRFLAYLHRGGQRYEMAQHIGAKNDFATAARLAREQGRVPPTNLLLRQALAHQSLEEHESATAIVGELLQREPGNADLYYNLGLLEGTQQHLPEARRWYERTLERQRDHLEAHGKLAYLAWRDAESFPRDLVRMRRHLAAYAEQARRSGSERTLADVESGMGTYWLAVARHRRDQDLAAAAEPSYLHALEHFEAALRHEPGCTRALNSIIQIGNELDWPAERTEPYRERMNAILKGEKGAPRAHRSSFC